jgi:hypothetical protein
MRKDAELEPPEFVERETPADPKFMDPGAHALTLTRRKLPHSEARTVTVPVRTLAVLSKVEKFTSPATGTVQVPAETAPYPRALARRR